jgi:hypothetical protein
MSPLLALNDIVILPMNVHAYKAGEQQGCSLPAKIAEQL